MKFNVVALATNPFEVVRGAIEVDSITEAATRAEQGYVAGMALQVQILFVVPEDEEATIEKVWHRGKGWGSASKGASERTKLLVQAVRQHVAEHPEEAIPKMTVASIVEATKIKILTVRQMLQEETMLKVIAAAAGLERVEYHKAGEEPAHLTGSRVAVAA